MSRIKILPESLANQIAAGEVVERPASVVKELLENSIDAGATAIEVHIDGAGTRSIQVIDNGVGMDQDDILLSLERHATSKLTSAEQLFSIKTLGFRGEAIPSIASVSRFTITSRTASSELGSSVSVYFGTIKKTHDMGCAVGTVIEVRDLFGNVPARRKFLKSAATELSHIEEVVRACCLANPSVAFIYQVSGRNVLQLMGGSDSAVIRFKRLVGSKDEIISLAGESDGVMVSGVVVPPEQAAGKSAKLWTFVNGRFVKDRLVTHAFAEGMQGFIMKGRRPGGLLFVEISPQDVDVNVHPAKQEVRFRNASLVHGVIANSVSASFKGYQAQLRNSVFGGPPAPVTSLAPICDASSSGVLPVASVPPALADKVEKADRDFRPEIQASSRQPSIFTQPLFPATTVREEGAEYFSQLSTLPRQEDVVKPCPAQTLVAAGSEEEVNPPFLRLIGQLFNTYLLCEVDDGFVVIDQHAAQERLFFEALKEQYAKASVPSQALLFPEMIELTSSEISALEENGEEIKRLGLDVQEFGGQTFVIKAVPASMSGWSGIEVLRSILDQFRLEEDRPRGNKLDGVFASMACKAAIKAGRKLLPLEIESLLASMQRAGIFSHCPHGRPVLKTFSVNDVQKWFHRT